MRQLAVHVRHVVTDRLSRNAYGRLLGSRPALMRQGEIMNAYSIWTTRELNDAIASDEGVLRKEGDRNFSVDRDALAAMKRERTSRWITDQRAAQR